MTIYDHTHVYSFGEAPEISIETVSGELVDVGDGQFSYRPDIYLVGVNPEREDGSWDSKEAAIMAFAMSFMELCGMAKGAYLRVRRAPILERMRSFDEDRGGWRMVGRFGIFRPKKSECENTSGEGTQEVNNENDYNAEPYSEA